MKNLNRQSLSKTIPCLCLTIAMCLAALTTQATPISIEFGGTFNSASGAMIGGISRGDPFTLLFTFDDSTPNFREGSDGVAKYSISPLPLLITSGANQFTATGLGIVWVDNGLYWVQMESGRVNSTWINGQLGGMPASTDIILRNDTGMTLDKSLSQDFNVDNWTTERSFSVNCGSYFKVDGEITSSRRVPEDMQTGLTLAGVTLLLGLLRRHAA